MKLRKPLTLAAFGFLVLALAGVLANRYLFDPLIVDVPHGNGLSVSTTDSSTKPLNNAQIEERLVAAGLNRAPTLGDIGVPGHLERLDRGQVSQSILLSYADDLREIARKIETSGSRIPASFWDVETPALKAAGWSVYKIAHELSQPQSIPYLDVIAKAYGRFVRFKAAANENKDSAVDAALDILLIARDYVHSVPEDRLLQHAPEIKTRTHAIVVAWQTLIAGSTRRNPITGQPVFSHGFIKRYNVSTIYQYDQAQGMSISDTWGVSGFAQRFVGTPDNTNQIEHLSISALLQSVMGEPLVVLNAIEEEKLLLGSERRGEALADMALNRAVHDVFLSKLDSNLPAAVEALRAELKRE